MILRHESSKWLESSIESDFDMQFAIRSLVLAFYDFCFFKHFYCKNRLLKRVNFLLICAIQENKIFISMILYCFCTREPPCMTLRAIHTHSYILSKFFAFSDSILLLLQDFPESCLNQYSPCYFGLLVPTSIPVFVVFMYFNWMGLKFFIHN